MAAPASPTHLRSLYRSLLRELPARPILASPRTSAHARLRASFAGEPAPSTPPSSPSHAIGTPAATAPLAEQLLAYLRAQRTYATLLERYNPGMDLNDEERLRLTARRVGMNMPLAYTAEGDGSK